MLTLRSMQVLLHFDIATPKSGHNRFSGIQVSMKIHFERYPNLCDWKEVGYVRVRQVSAIEPWLVCLV